MKYYVTSVVEYIAAQLRSVAISQHGGKRLQLMIPSLPPCTTFRLANALEEFCFQNQLKLEFKVAQELSCGWSDAEQAELVSKDYLATGSLTGLRNTLTEGDKITLQILVGSACVTDKGSLADFHQCDLANIWSTEMNRSFSSWLSAFFDDVGAFSSPESIAQANVILKELAERFDILKISDLLENVQPVFDSADEIICELLQKLDDFGLPNLSGFCGAPKGRSFRYYVDSAYSFFSYDAFMDPGKRKKASENLSAFRNDKAQTIVLEKLGLFQSEDEFWDTLADYIANNDKTNISLLKNCDFLFIWDTILKFRPPRETRDKLTVRKLSGAPLEVVLHALYLSLQKTDTTSINKILLTGKLFKHDYSTDGGTESIEAKEALTQLFGGIDKILEEHIQISRKREENKIEIESQLLHDEVAYSSAKTSEPFFQFQVTIEEEMQAQEFHFAMRLPDIHSYRLANSLLLLADNGLQERGLAWSSPIPVFHLNYYRELMVAKDEEEICRVLLHCINECRPGTVEFMENIYTKTWYDRPEALKLYLEKISVKYRDFIKDASKNGLYTALFNSAKPLIDAFHQATEAFISDENCARCQKLAAMLMRAFLIIDIKKNNIDTWAVEPFEKNGIVTILHPSMVEMLQAQAVFLLTAFSGVVKSELETAKPSFKESKWQYYVDMAAIQMPLGGLLTDNDGKLSIDVRGKDLLHRIIGEETSLVNASMATRLLTRYDQLDDEDISDTDIFKDTRESKLLLRILNEYRLMHPHAQDGITIAVYRNDDIQPVLAALNGFLKQLSTMKIISPERHLKYAVKLVLFSESADDTGINNWLEEWQERWEAAETEEKLKYYTWCQLTVAHRIVSREDDRKQFERILKTELDCDVIVFYNFIEAGRSGNKFKAASKYDNTQDTLKFPILEKAFCSNPDPDEILTRSQIISNRQFRINADHTEIMARLKNHGTELNQYHVILGSGNFAPWQKIIEAAHNAAEWVVCVDANIDDKLIAERGEAAITEKRRELIGFGSGVGVHGESNFTISTQKFTFADLRRILRNSFKSIYKFGNPQEDAHITDELMLSAGALSGLSLIRALGPSYYICDFLSYSLMHKILPIAKERHLCNQLFSIDAYHHWFDISSADDKTHPDLLWLRADITQDGRITIDVKIIECKMRQENQGALDEAKGQIQNGLDVLVKAFMPKKEGVEIPDGRYWYLQLHRLIASSARAENLDDESLFLAAMERLAAGDFLIKWSAGIFAFWTDSQQSVIKECDCYGLDSNGREFSVPVYTIGYKFIRNLCHDMETPILSWEETEVQFSAQKVDNSPVEEREIWQANETCEDGEEVVLALPESEDDLAEGDQPEQIDAQEDYFSAESPDSSETDNTLKTVTEALPVSHTISTEEIPERIFLGKEGTRDYYWEFGHKELSNRHLLIFGNSGMGKTYAIQAILCELGRQSQNSLIVDYTYGFLPKQLDKTAVSALKPMQQVVKQNKLPINPFQRYTLDIGDGIPVENSNMDIAKRVTATFDSVYNMGDQQRGILIDAIYDGLTNSNDFRLDDTLTVLKSFIGDGEHQKGSVQTLITKLKPFITEQPFVANAATGWKELFADVINKCHVFQLAGVDKETSRILTEFILWDLYAFADNNSTEATPKVIVLDEVQNLDHSQDAPLGKILREGRKFGLSVIAATQTLSNLKKEEQAQLFQAAHKLFFQPAGPELAQYAEIAVQFANNGTKESWKTKLSALNKGECLSIGPVLNEQTGKLRTEVHKIKIAALTERGF